MWVGLVGGVYQVVWVELGGGCISSSVGGVGRGVYIK